MRRLMLAAIAAASVLVLAPSHAAAGGTVCAGAVSGYWSSTITSGGKVIARVWMHHDAAGRSCTVLRAVKWRGQAHYMYLRVCGPRRRGCTGWDAGLYRYYAGPIYSTHAWCQQIRVKVDSPTGHRVVDGWVNGPCD